MRARCLTVMVAALLFSVFVQGYSDVRPHSFVRLATFEVFQNGAKTATSAAEILAATDDGKLLVYTDSESGNLGLVDISRPQTPRGMGLLEAGGEPTSVAVMGNLALAVVARPDNQGHLRIFDLKTRQLLRELEIGGQPDCIVLSPDRAYAAIAVENETKQARPAPPAGFLAVVDLSGPVRDWRLRKVALTGVAERFPDDPEPEYVDINAQNLAAVTLQENNHIVLVDLPSGKITGHFSAGTAEMSGFDLTEDRHIAFTQKAAPREREPDAINWTSQGLATADEGDLTGGSRSFSIFSPSGKILYSSGSELDRLAARLGHYPDHRSEDLGSEPEGLETAVFGSQELLFVGMERANLVAVYRLGKGLPQLLQALPSGAGPEGILALPKRRLLLVAGEWDAPKKGVRSNISIFAWQPQAPFYPQISSSDLPWCALSGLAAGQGDTLYAVADGRLQPSQIFELRTDSHPARLLRSIVVGKNYDLEGIAMASEGGFWAVSEGKHGKPNLLLRIGPAGQVENEIRLPTEVEARVGKFGFEGVAELDGDVYVCFQKNWQDEPGSQVRIGRYRPSDQTWQFAFYALDEAGLGLSDLCPWSPGRLAVIERDNRAGSAARHKKVYSFSVAEFPRALPKKLERDLLPDLAASGGVIPEKVEGLARTSDGKVWVVSDNDGVKDAPGETFFFSF